MLYTNYIAPLPSVLSIGNGYRFPSKEPSARILSFEIKKENNNNTARKSSFKFLFKMAKLKLLRTLGGSEFRCLSASI